MEPIAIARVVHEANRALQIEQADPTVSPASPWEECGSEMRASAVDGVVNVIKGATPEQSHENWVRFKREHGWVYGERKSETDKTHPCLVPYAELPESQRIKDDLFGAIVGALAGKRVPYMGRVRLQVDDKGVVDLSIGRDIASATEEMERPGGGQLSDRQIEVIAMMSTINCLQGVIDDLNQRVASSALAALDALDHEDGEDGESTIENTYDEDED